MMIRYHLDDLGWYQFEWLIQSLLKAECGLGIESWGGRGDFGRDAYSKGPLNCLSKHLIDGPFVFQVKFIQNANATGAKFDQQLSNSIQSEIRKIKDRKFQKKWGKPNYYILITNAPLIGNLKIKLKEKFEKAAISENVSTLGGNDVCDLLDKHQNIRRAFPQLLSLRDLDDLIQSVVNKDVIEKSISVIEEARDIAPVFVPTEAYNNAWKVISKHNFVVLEGPPEMGKSAIAWMMGLTQLAIGWQVLVCDKPDDFFRNYDSQTHQSFIADDAFGRTEYDATRGKEWEGQLDRILKRLNSDHWLIWTTRKHILERALQSIDFQGLGRKFPEPNAVLVEASQLSAKEKALMLYRHSRSANLEGKAKAIIKANARLIVNNASFTPERIRRFVMEALPELMEKELEPDNELIVYEIQKAIQTPTDRMKKTFRVLPDHHKLFLTTLLEAAPRTSLEEFRKMYESRSNSLNVKYPFDEILDELSESFIKLWRLSQNTPKKISWIHPSYRDLIIEELTLNKDLRSIFLRYMSIEGIKLAISDAGGERGERSLPFMANDDSWNLLQQRCEEIAEKSEPHETQELLTILADITRHFKKNISETRLPKVVTGVCQSLLKRWEENKHIISSHELSLYSKVSIVTEPLIQIPDLAYSWQVHTVNFRNWLGKGKEEGYIEDYIEFEEWVEFADSVKMAEPRFLEQVGFPHRYKNEIEDLIDLIDSELQVDLSGEQFDLLISEAEKLDVLYFNLGTLQNLYPERRYRLSVLVSNVERTRDKWENEAGEQGPPFLENDDDYERSTPPTDSFDIDILFEDL